MSHDESGLENLGIVLRHPDGRPFTKEEVIIKRRGALKWLPVKCSNDLVHGSWWFVWGSVGCVLFALFPLIDIGTGGNLNLTDDTTPKDESEASWSLLVLSSVFFGLGSYAFVRAFEEPRKRPLFWWNKHVQSDELLGAWLFLFGALPSIPYAFILWIEHPAEVMFLGAVFLAIIMCAAMGLFVKACYPHDENSKAAQNYILPLFKRWFGPQLWVTRHCANDWLSACWFILWGNLLYTAVSFLALLSALIALDSGGIFVWISSFLNSFMFLIGSAYFVSGSYPFAGQFYYYKNRANLDFEHTLNPFRKSANPDDASATKSSSGNEDQNIVVQGFSKALNVAVSTTGLVLGTVTHVVVATAETGFNIVTNSNLHGASSGKPVGAVRRESNFGKVVEPAPAGASTRGEGEVFNPLSAEQPQQPTSVSGFGKKKDAYVAVAKEDEFSSFDTTIGSKTYTPVPPDYEDFEPPKPAEPSANAVDPDDPFACFNTSV